jgi:hypothetical protein
VLPLRLGSILEMNCVRQVCLSQRQRLVIERSRCLLCSGWQNQFRRVGRRQLTGHLVRCAAVGGKIRLDECAPGYESIRRGSFALGQP